MAMRSKKAWYMVHRWLGLIVGLQLLAWATGGFVFSVLDIEDVRGELDADPRPPLPLAVHRIEITPGEAMSAASAHGISSVSVTRAVLCEHRGRTVYELVSAEGEPLAVVDASTGQVIQRISEAQATAAALADFAPETVVESISLLEGEPPMEYRGGAMPVYRVVLAHPKSPHVYVSPVTGKVLRRRNKLWRLFDFFWMLHTMDYRGRDDFNHWLLTTMSLLAILTSASGIALWWWRLPLHNRGK